MTIPVIFGEVLYDRFPDGKTVLGGAPFNVAWNLQAFGLAPRFVSRVGNNDLGWKIIQAMEAWDMDVTGIQTDPAHPTGTVEVSFRNGEPSYDIAPDKAYDHIVAGPEDPREDILLYHGTLIRRNDVSRSTLERWRTAARGSVFIDANLRAPWWDRTGVLETIGGAAWVKLNEMELRKLVPVGKELAEKALQLVAKYRLSCLIVTRGAAGATAYADGGVCIECPAAVAPEVVDTVGAGDAFSSVFVAGLICGWSLETIMERAQEFAGAVVGLRGATSDDRGFYSRIIENWENT